MDVSLTKNLLAKAKNGKTINKWLIIPNGRDFSVKLGRINRIRAATAATHSVTPHII